MFAYDEDLEGSWRARYGVPPPDGIPADLAPFLRHRSIRDFADRDVDEATVTGLVAAAQSAATSSNLQLWSLVSVRDPQRRAAIAELSADQRQIHDAAWFFAFLIDHHRLAQVAHAAQQDPAGLDFIEFYTMAVVDAALAAERMTCAAQALGLGVCYIGALRDDADGVRELLELPDSVFGLFGLCLGWPSDDCTAALKPRLAQRTLWHRETYDRKVDITEYDERMRAFYESQSQRSDVSWSMRSGRRVDGDRLAGRATLRAWLEKHGFNRR